MHGMQQDSLAEYTSTVQSDGLIIQSGAHVCVSTRVIHGVSRPCCRVKIISLFAADNAVACNIVKCDVHGLGALDD